MVAKEIVTVVCNEMREAKEGWNDAKKVNKYKPTHSIDVTQGDHRSGEHQGADTKY